MEAEQPPPIHIPISPSPQPHQQQQQPHPVPWLTVDGPLGLHDPDSARKQARYFFYGGFAFLPWLWFVNCFYFWPVLRRSHHPDPVLRSYVMRSAVGFMAYTSILLIWVLTFTIGGERIFGSYWDKLVVYKLADNIDLTGSF